MTYQNTMSSYAKMDIKFAKSRLNIGWSSNLAQLAMTYYWTELQKDEPNKQDLNDLYDNFVILSVLAQAAIDSIKREYEVDVSTEIKRIQKMPCMVHEKHYTDNKGNDCVIRCDYPLFMKYTKDIPKTKNGKDLPTETITNEKQKLDQRIDTSLVCPMNWLIEELGKIQGASTKATTPTGEFFIKMNGRANKRQMSKIGKLVNEYVDTTKELCQNSDSYDFGDFTTLYLEKTNELVDAVKKIKIGDTITINRLVEIALNLQVRIAQKDVMKACSKNSKALLDVLYRTNKSKFTSCFTEE